jgi:mutator protein MutT
LKSNAADDHLPISVKGVVVCDGAVVLLQNERDEWELPGGRIDPGETPQQCVAREIGEELGIAVEVGPMLDTWIYAVTPNAHVTIVTFGIVPMRNAVLTLSAEHKRLGRFASSEIDGLNMPSGYKASIAAWLARVSVR